MSKTHNEWTDDMSVDIPKVCGEHCTRLCFATFLFNNAFDTVQNVDVRLQRHNE
jgi:hypothetical protein